jgi:broad specificity phosphatase PhoE
MTLPREVKLWLLRHPVVDDQFKGLCYGSDDVPLKSGWESSIESSIDRFAAWQAETIWTSDLQRARQPGQAIHQRLLRSSRSRSGPTTVEESPLLRERFYGSWQGLAWSAIPAEELDHAHDMLEHPETYRPGGGETTSEVIDRAQTWFKAFLSSNYRRTIVVSHSGWITSLVGSLLKLKPIDWKDYYLKPFEGFDVTVSEDFVPTIQRFEL